MTNSYDVQHYPQDLDERRQREMGSMPEAVAIRSRLADHLRGSVMEAQNLATFYSNFGHQLELCLSQLESKK